MSLCADPYLTTDIQDVKKVEGAIFTTVTHFGHLELLVADAAILRPVERRTLTLCAVLFQVTVDLGHR